MADTYVGVDRCADGWLAVSFSGTEFDDAAVFEEVGHLWEHFETAARILVDVPIGLVEEGREHRECDDLARDVLGPRHATVFTPPVREAARKRRYQTAQRVQERKVDAGLSKQAFAISDSIVAVDELVRNVPEAREAIRESHPEVCYRAFAGEPLEYSKRSAGGYAERMRTLAAYDPDGPPTVQSTAEAVAGADVSVHDVLDAVVLAYAASPGAGDLRTLPPDPPLDAKGLPMEIVYRATRPLVGSD